MKTRIPARILQAQADDINRRVDEIMRVSDITAEVNYDIRVRRRDKRSVLVIRQYVAEASEKKVVFETTGPYAEIRMMVEAHRAMRVANGINTASDSVVTTYV